MEIEKRTYDAHQFLEELKQMVTEVVMTVLADNTNRRITIQEAVTLQEKEPKKRERKATTPKPKKEKGAASLPTSMSVAAGQVCPLCGKELSFGAKLLTVARNGRTVVASVIRWISLSKIPIPLLKS